MGNIPGNKKSAQLSSYLSGLIKGKLWAQVLAGMILGISFGAAAITPAAGTFSRLNVKRNAPLVTFHATSPSDFPKNPRTSKHTINSIRIEP